MREGVKIVYFGVILGVILRVSLGREWLGFVRRCGSNDFWVSSWILWRVSRVELLYRYGKTL